MYGDDQYLEAKVLTATPLQLHLLVVDGAIRHAARAQQALEQSDVETAHASLGTSRDFVSELISGLDAGQAPQLVDSLKALFVFVYRKLVAADVERNPQLVREALVVLRKHRETWTELAQQLLQQQAQSVPQSADKSWTS
jgi:flagellar protein FliS